jgi:adenylate cyclase
MAATAAPTDPVTNNRDVKEGAKGILQSLRRLFDQLGPIRLASTILFMVLALLVARYSWTTPLIQEAERALYDLRASVFAPEIEKDENIVMVVYNEDTLKLTGQRSPVDRTILAQALETIDAANPKSIGIDILFTMPQDDDALLISAFKNMKTPTFLAYADPKENPEIAFAEHEFLQQFFEEARTENVRPTDIKLETDSDGVQRRWTPHRPGAPPFMAIALTGPNPKFAQNDGAIRYHVPTTTDVPVFDKFPIESFADPAIAEMLGSFIAGKHVLIGGDFVDRDRFETPVGGLADIKGDDGKLNDDLPTPIPAWTLWLGALIVAVCGGLSALIVGNALKVGFMLLGQFAFFLIFPFVLQNIGIDTLSLPAFGWGVGWLLGYASVGSAARTINSKQRAFAQSALGKYLPKSIASEILKDPEKLALHGEKRKIFAVFTDLEGFTKLTHAIEPEMVAYLLNDYLDRLSEVALEYGGTIDKFVGDALVTFWGAPIAYPDDGERAAKAAYALYLAGEEFRKNVPEGVPPIGRTRVGMHYGDAIVGNFGGEGRIQYTALGDAMNTAARLEAANKTLETKVLLSREAMERTGLDWYRPMGRITLRGRSTPVDVFEPVPDWEEKDRAAVTAIIAAHEIGDSGSIQARGAVIKQYGEDLGLVNLLKRLKKTKNGESYALG